MSRSPLSSSELAVFQSIDHDSDRDLALSKLRAAYFAPPDVRCDLLEEVADLMLGVPRG